MAVETSRIEATLYKDPNAKLDYRFDWGTEYLAGDTINPGDTISVSTWTSTPSGLTSVATSVSGGNTLTNIRLSGGVVGTTYTVTNHVVFASGQEDERSFYLKVVDR